MHIDQFDFDLPERLIALRPVRPRPAARLLVVRGATGELEDRHVSDLPELLSAGDILVTNETRVIMASLKAVRPARAEDAPDIDVQMNLNRQEGAGLWSVFAKPGKRLKVDDVLVFSSDLRANILEKRDGGELLLRFSLEGDALTGAIDALGDTPLPPYITAQRAPDEADKDDYQTCFATSGVSVAAPTAGLHFTPELMRAIEKAGVDIASVNLDVNAGTFLPMKAERLEDHRMHAERARLSEETASRINEVRASGGCCVAVGTTALRTLESAACGGKLAAFDDDTSIFIKPGHNFGGADALMTNFHLPKSTLYVLVCAMMGVDVMQRAYRHAVDNSYRFYSYGDACLLLPNG